MTVSTQVSRNEYIGNGATTQYDFTFRIMDKSELFIQTLDASETIRTLTLGIDYSVTGVNRYPGGKVVLSTPLPDGYKISIERSIPVTQETSVRNQGGFFPEIHEDAFDKLTMIIQRMYGWWSGLALKKPSWLANYYDAQNNRIRNLRDPAQAQDAATKNYTDNLFEGANSHTDSLFRRTLRVPESLVGMLPSSADRAWKGLGFDGAGQPKLQDPAGTGLWGYVPAIGSFEKGSLLTQRFEVLLWESTEEYWRWDGAMPKIVLPGSTPDTAGGRGKGKWLDVTDATLRSNLGSGEDYFGGGLVAFDHKAKYQTGSIAALAIANFQDEQPIQYYYDNNGGDWDEAIFEAQLAVYLYGFSPRLRLPHGIVEITRPILGGVALGDYIHSRYPELNFYDSTTGNYAAVWPLHLEGSYLYASDITSRTTLGTQIKLTVDDNTVTTYKDMGIIHAGPTEYEQVRRTASITKKWPGQGLVIRNVNVAGATKDGSLYPWVHGIYTFGSAKNLIENVVVNNVWGAGILFDWVFDSLIKNVRFMGCGRMQTRTYYADGKTSADYQLYAPFMTLYSPGSNVSDNTNFIRLEGCHWEDNYTAADVIISGVASPVWITDPHFECATVAGTAAGAGTKTCLCAGGFGVRYFMEESQDGWDSSVATVRTSAGQGNVLWRGGGIYSATYEYQVQQAGYGTVSLESNLFPNYSKVRVRTSSTGAGFRAVNSIIGDISFSGGNSSTAPLILEGCPSVGAIAMSYTHPARLSNVNATSLTVSNPFVSLAYPWVLDCCTFEYINMATVANAMGKVYLTSTTVASSFRTGLGKLVLAYYAYFATNLAGALQTAVHETTLTVTSTTIASALLQEGRYQYPVNNILTTGLAFSGRQVLDVINDTPGSYVVQTATGIATAGYLKYYRIIPYTDGNYGTPTPWIQIA